MDPVSIIGLVASIQQLSDRTGIIVVQLCDYFVMIKEAPARSKELRNELQTISNILLSLTNLLKEHPIAGLSETLETSLTEFREVLDGLEQRIRPESTRGIRRFLWPFSKTSIERILSKIERCKTAFSLALHVQQSY
jgi:hypothetical protein